MSKANGQEDFIAQGFHQLDDRLIHKHAPKIVWGLGYQDKPDEAKVRYLEKLAATMNHAARLISDERDELVKLMVLKEQQLKIMTGQIRANNEMLQSEVMRMNKQKQQYHQNISALNARIKELEHGNHD